MTPEEYDQKVKELEAKAQAERQAIIDEFMERQGDIEAQKREAHEIMIDNAEGAATVITQIARGQVFDKDGNPPSAATRLKAADLVYRYAILETAEKDKDETEDLIDRLTAPPQPAATSTAKPKPRRKRASN